MDVCAAESGGETDAGMSLGMRLDSLLRYLHTGCKTWYDAEKPGIQEELKVYDPLWEENSKVRRIRAESKAEGLQMALLSAVSIRFPELSELAQKNVGKINDTANLDMLLKQVITAPDESFARWLLSSVAA